MNQRPENEHGLNSAGQDERQPPSPQKKTLHVLGFPLAMSARELGQLFEGYLSFLFFSFLSLSLLTSALGHLLRSFDSSISMLIKYQIRPARQV